jgi:hypothetical protein
MANLTINQLPTKAVLATDEIELQATGGGSSGKTTVANLKGFVSVKDFGAVGDGVTDDSTAIAAAIASVSTLFATTRSTALYFPEGVYLITQNNWLGANLAMTWTGLSDLTLRGAGRDSSVILFKPSVSGGACYDQSLTATKHLIGFIMENMGVEFDNSANGSNPVHFIKSVATAAHASQNFRLNNCQFIGVVGSVLFSLAGDVNEDVISCTNLRVVDFATVLYSENLESYLHHFYSLDLINITGDVFNYVAGGSLGVYGCNAILSGTAGVDTALLRIGGGTTSQTYYLNNVRTELRGAKTRVLNIAAESENTITFESCNFFANTPSKQSWALAPAQHKCSITFINCVLPVRTATALEGAFTLSDSTSGLNYETLNGTTSKIAFINCDQEGSRLVDMPQGWMNYDALTAPNGNYRNCIVTYEGCGGVSDMTEYGHAYRAGRTLLPHSPPKMVFRGTTFPQGNGVSAAFSNAQDLNVLIPWNAFVTEIVVMRKAMVTAATNYQIEFVDTAEFNSPGSGVIFGNTTAKANDLAIFERVPILRQFTGTAAQRTIWCRMKAGFTLGASVGTPTEGGIYAEVL